MRMKFNDYLPSFEIQKVIYSIVLLLKFNSSIVASSSKLEYCSFGILFDSNCKRISEDSFSSLNVL